MKIYRADPAMYPSLIRPARLVADGLLPPQIGGKRQFRQRHSETELVDAFARVIVIGAVYLGRALSAKKQLSEVLLTKIHESRKWPDR